MSDKATRKGGDPKATSHSAVDRRDFLKLGGAGAAAMALGAGGCTPGDVRPRRDQQPGDTVLDDRGESPHGRADHSS